MTIRIMDANERVDAPLLLTVDEAARTLASGRSNIYKLVASGEIPSIRIGASIRIPVDALKAWIDSKL